VDSELAATTSAGSVFQMCGAATAKARLPTVDSLTCGTTEAVGIGRTECSSNRQVVDTGQRTEVTWCVATNSQSVLNSLRNPQPVQTDASIGCGTSQAE